MSSYNRIFYGTSCSSQTTCPTSCYNITDPNQNSTKPTVYDDLPVSVTGLAGAVEYYADQLRRRLGATMTLRSPSETQFIIELKRGSRIDTVTWALASTQGAYPVTVSYVAPHDSESSVRFEHVLHAIDWLIQRLA